MVRRRRMQRPVMPGPNMARNAGMSRPNMARNAGFGRKPKTGRGSPMPLEMPESAARQIGAMPAGMKPRNTFWSRVPIIGSLMNLIAGFLFPTKKHLLDLPLLHRQYYPVPGHSRRPSTT